MHSQSMSLQSQLDSQEETTSQIDSKEGHWPGLVSRARAGPPSAVSRLRAAAP
jgi:hypothetical protein